MSRVADKHHITDSGVLPQRDKARPRVGVQKGTHLGLDRGQLSLQPHHQHRVLVLQLPDAALVAAQEACRLLTLRIGLLQLQHTQQVFRKKFKYRSTQTKNRSPNNKSNNHSTCVWWGGTRPQQGSSNAACIPPALLSRCKTSGSLLTCVRREATSALNALTSAGVAAPGPVLSRLPHQAAAPAAAAGVSPTSCCRCCKAGPSWPPTSPSASNLWACKARQADSGQRHQKK